MLKVVLIGSSGHYGYALEGIRAGAACAIAAAAPGPGGGLDVAAKQAAGEIYSDYKSMLDKEKPDIAVINPHFFHISECAAEALSRGINIFCEKPLAVTWEGLDQVEKAAKKSGARLCAMMGMRTEAAFAGMHKAISEGATGNIRLIHAQKSYKLGSRPDFYKTRRTYGGTLPWVGSHPIDMIYWLTGRKKYIKVFAGHSAKANRGHGELEATAAMMLEMEDEILATVNIDYLRPASSDTHGDDRICVMGDAGWCEIVGGRLYVNGMEQQAPERGNIFKDLCMELAGEGLCSITNKDSIYVTKICLAARDSADNGKIVDIRE
jgi:predicted dehydrogenase